VPSLGGPCRNIAIPFGMEKLEWWGYPTAKKIEDICNRLHQSCTTLDPTRGSVRVGSGRVGSDWVRKFAGKGGSGRVKASSAIG